MHAPVPTMLVRRAGGPWYLRALRATLAVARKLVAYLLAVDKSRKPFQLREKDEEEPDVQLPSEAKT